MTDAAGNAKGDGAEIPADLEDDYQDFKIIPSNRKEQGWRNYARKLIERIASLTQECAGLRERLAQCESALDQSTIVRAILHRLNNRLVDIRPEWDDSLTGFNDAMDIVRDVLTDPIRAAINPPASTHPPAAPANWATSDPEAHKQAYADACADAEDGTHK